MIENRCFAGAGLLALVGLAPGCGQNFDPPTELNGVRVLAVRPQGDPTDAGVPASGTPGAPLRLEMLVVDGRVPPSAPGEPVDARPLQIIWLGGCHNPPSRFFYGCGPFLQALAERVEAGSEGDLPPGFIGIGPSFELPIPGDILNIPRLPTDPLHFGVSYAFFGVCAGNIVPRPERTEGVPLDCVDASGTPLGPGDSVFGFSTLYTYEGVMNHNPELPRVEFDGLAVVGCTDSDTCDVPVVPACKSDGNGCREYRIAPIVAPLSFERAPDGKSEILWASYYATEGEITKATQLVADRNVGRVGDYSSGWRPPAEPGRVRLFVTVNDERAGAAWASFDVEVQ